MALQRYVKVDNVSRRSILKGLGLAGGFVLAAPVMSRPGLAAYQTGADKMPHGTVVDPRVFVAIAPDGIVTIVAHRAEMGTGVRTSLPMIVAEEMEADWSRVRIQQAHGDEVKFGNQDTDGSRSTRHYLMPMRQIGASARTMLEAAAAKRWGVPATEVKAVNHEVVHSASGRRIGFGDLAADAAKESVPSVEGLKLKDPKDFRYLGKGQISMVDLRDITVGTARYGADVRLPGMKYAVIARPPVTGGKVASFDGAAAMKVSGVEKVMEVKGWPWPSKFQPLGGVAVIARNTGAAIKGRDALKIVWDDGANGKYDSVAYRAELEAAARKPGLVLRKEGDVEAALKGADKVIVGEYYLPHLAHVAMEPPVAVADVKRRQGGDLGAGAKRGRNARGRRQDAWHSPGECHRQRHPARRRLRAQVEVRFRHRSRPAFEGTRRPRQGAMDAGRRRSQRLPAHRLGGTHRGRSRQERQGDGLAPSQRRAEHRLDICRQGAASGAVRTRHGARRHALRDRQRPVRESGSGRAYPHRLVPLGVEHPARLRGAVDGRRNRPWPPNAIQKDMLLELIGSPRIVKLDSVKDLWNYGEPYDSYPIDTARLRKVVELVADKGGWGRSVPKGHGLGIAAHRSFVSYIATIVEVAVDDKGKLTVPRVDTAIDCGTYVNPERIQSQIEGAAIMGMSLAKHGAITFKDGKVQQGNFDDFPVIRIDEFPASRTSTSCRPAPTRRPAASASRACRPLRRR